MATENIKITPKKLIALKQENKKIVALTAYDFLFAAILQEVKIDVILVGDSLAMVFQGEANTLSVSVDDMIYHTRCVARTSETALIVTDMPFLSYHITSEEALRNAGNMARAGAEAVKIEGGVDVCQTIERIVKAGIPVMGHIGLTPQDILASGGYFVQGCDDATAKKILTDAQAVQNAGASSIVLECVPSGLAKEISQSLAIPTIGIGAGIHCDGQILVTHDMLGMYKKFKPKFLKRYANMHDVAIDAIKQYADDVRNKKFPTDSHSY